MGQLGILRIPIAEQVHRWYSMLTEKSLGLEKVNSQHAQRQQEGEKGHQFRAPLPKSRLTKPVIGVTMHSRTIGPLVALADSKSI